MADESGKYLIGIYPGTFDPFTKGHLDLIARAAKLVDRLIIGVAENPHKKPLFTHEERAKLLQHDIDAMDLDCDIQIKRFTNLLVDFAQEEKASCIFRGLRAVSDFEYEFQMTGMNAKLNPAVDTVFLMASEKWQFVSSSFVKEICNMGGDVSGFVTAGVLNALQGKLKQ